MLARKHTQLWQAQRALDSGDTVGTHAAATAALALDPESALAQVALARAALAQGDPAGALAALDQARAVLPAHPYAHLLRGAILRDQGDLAGARAEFSYEQASLEDLQGWSWQAFAPFAVLPSAVEIGDGLDLGSDFRRHQGRVAGGFAREHRLATLYDGDQMPFKDDQFDTSLLLFVLHHSPDPEKLLRVIKISELEAILYMMHNDPTVRHFSIDIMFNKVHTRYY
jgi:tetratricopeptide (TPR) repeat protein